MTKGSVAPEEEQRANGLAIIAGLIVLVLVGLVIWEYAVMLPRFDGHLG